MSTTDEPVVSFADSDTRHDEMHSTITEWVDDLVEAVEDAQTSEEFQAWLDVQSQFHDYSYRNTLLIKQQCPEATRVAGYRTWQNEFDRHVKGGKSAIWIWVPIIAKQCPKCQNSLSYHENSDCEYDKAPPEEWSKGLVGFRPAPVFDVSQTEGEDLPNLDTSAEGDTEALFPAMLDAAEDVSVEVELVPDKEWKYGDAKGVCRESPDGEFPLVELLCRDNDAAAASTLVHEYAHALLHVGVDDDTERSKREVEAEAVAYIVGRQFSLDMDGSAFYLATWERDDADVIRDRLARISRTSQTLIEYIERHR
ncbi:ImmA/IrrE family metallo-endopeptidase [Haloferax namakaokahaiae]|uniref:ImmA/IrrE family metallo-endopeptidase n=1 Tax=Haloferax namakaokahaiae TaxID=1748331 RepID=A0ABD5ZJH1_9EURY